MSDPRYWIATHEPGFFTPKHVLSLPDAEHIHITRHPDGTITAVPMRRGRFCGPGGVYPWFDIEEPS